MYRGGRHVRGDLSLNVQELLDEQDEQRRASGDTEVPALQVNNVDFSYGSVQVLFDVAFEVKKGETLALLGTNGAGKSTILRGYQRPGRSPAGSSPTTRPNDYLLVAPVAVPSRHPATAWREGRVSRHDGAPEPRHGRVRAPLRQT